jgi:hypothetical protein
VRKKGIAGFVVPDSRLVGCGAFSIGKMRLSAEESLQLPERTEEE